MPGRKKLTEFVAWCGKKITGDEKDQAQIVLDRFLQTPGSPGGLDETAQTPDTRHVNFKFASQKVTKVEQGPIVTD